jgi:hypothetical protein
MSEDRSSSDIFSFDRKQAASYATSDIAPYLPYADTWKKFDKLQLEVKGRGGYRWVRAAFDFLVYTVTVFGLHHFSKNNRLTIVMAGAVLTVFGLLRGKSAKDRFLHWPCPRCHSEWPGDKTDKDPACKVCGLRLHQPTP